MAVLLAMAGCGPSRDARSLRPTPVFSPNGELLSRGGPHEPSCPAAVGEWWENLAAGHDGVVDKDTFLADAKAQFAAMDLDHDGFITPYELSEYRAGADEQMGERGLPPGVTAPSQSAAIPSGHGRRGGIYDDSAVQPRVARTQIPADLVDPVMSADKSLSFKVSLADFMAQASDLFAEMDKNREGRIGKDAVIALRCPISR
jgi:hypothetical protein